MQKNLNTIAKKQSGITLISMAIFIVVTGIVITVGIRLYNTWNGYQAQTITVEGLEKIQSALHTFLLENGRYPCPAPLDAPLDSTRFGVEANCTTGAAVAAGTFQSQGRNGRLVRTGSVPVRNLGIDDEYIADGYRHRYIYSVTEAYADHLNPVPEGDSGAIFVRDSNNNPSTSTDGNLVQLVYSMGWDKNGAYSINGALQQPCNNALASGENCDFFNNALFINTINKSSKTDDPFVTRVSYRPSKTIVSCVETSPVPPRDVVFLVDTSGSMNEPVANCPASIGSPCRRIDIAHWAMRRLVPARIKANSRITGDQAVAGTTALTGFAPGTDGGSTSAYLVETRLGNIIIDDPQAPGYQEPDFEQLTSNLEDKLKTMCGHGATPLGVHLDALAKRLQDGDDIQPKKIIVVSDGQSNRGETPLSVANKIINNYQYKNLQIDIIDVTGENANMQAVTDLTGGAYYNPESADEFLQALYNASGVCGPLDNLDEPEDNLYCQ